jgi:hypothetical protein
MSVNRGHSSVTIQSVQQALDDGWRPASRATIAVLVLIILLLPPMLFYFSEASSMALGASIAALIVIAILMSPVFMQDRTRSSALVRPTIVTLAVVLGITAHALVAALMVPIDVVRAAGSLFPLALILFSGYALGRTLAASSSANVHGAIHGCFAVFCLVGLLAIIGLEPASSESYFKPVFPFTEPSYFALAFTPLLIYCCITTAGSGRILVLLTGLSLAFLLENFTLVLGCLLATFLCFRRALIAVLVLAVALAAIQLLQLDLSYYTQRLDFTSESANLSGLVYLQGWQLIIESLTRSGGWGLGFQQLGIQGTQVPAADLILNLTSDYSNLLGGGFTFAKLVSEFGAIGVLLTVLFLFLAWRTVRALRRTTRAPRQVAAALTFSRCVIATYLLEFFIRGSGYFHGLAILFVGALWLRPAELPRRSLQVKPALGH